MNIQTVENNSTNLSQSQSLMSKQVEGGTSQKPMEVDEERLNENDSFHLQKKSISLLAKVSCKIARSFKITVYDYAIELKKQSPKVFCKKRCF